MFQFCPGAREHFDEDPSFQWPQHDQNRWQDVDGRIHSPYLWSELCQLEFTGILGTVSKPAWTVPPFLELIIDMLWLGPLLSEGSEISVIPVSMKSFFRHTEKHMFCVITMIFSTFGHVYYFVLEVQVAGVCKLSFFFSSCWLSGLYCRLGKISETKHQRSNKSLQA